MPVTLPYPGEPATNASFKSDRVRENIQAIADYLSAINGDDIQDRTIPAVAMVAGADPELRGSELMLDHIALGMNPSGFTGLTINFPSGTLYYSGVRILVSAQGFSVLANKDSYFYVDKLGVINHTDVANGAARPSLPANSVWLRKVVSNGSTITSSTDLRDTNGFVKTIDYVMPVQGANFTTTSATYVDVTNLTFDYESGQYPERLELDLDIMCGMNANANATVILNIAGVDQSTPIYFGQAADTTHRHRKYIYDIAANTKVTIKVRAKTDANTLTINTNGSDFVPSIRGTARRRAL